MKYLKTILTAALSMWMMQSFAQTPLDSLRDFFKGSAVSIECDYTTTVQNTKIAGHSDILVQGDMYTMSGNGLEVFCNGEAMWTIDESSYEVVVEPYAAQDRDYMANPMLLLVDLDELFIVRNCTNLGNSNVNCLLDAVRECGVTQASLELTKSGEIVKAGFILDDGNILEVEVSAMKKTEEKQKSFFSPQQKFGSDWIVTDLR